MSTSTTDPLIGRLIDGRYQVRSRIARGGMATVYLATDLRLERRVAVKVMHGHLADDSQFKQRFIQEARSAARLAHPNVVNVFDQGQDDDSAYLVMEYLPGITLRDLLQDHGALTPEQTIDITEAVLSGLAAAHKAGIVHRDLKPENVLLADDGRIKIGDFGLARAASANTATGAALLGTIAYLSPELVTRGIADTRSDIYAVGIMMYEMLTGEQPFKGEQPMQIAYQHANDSVPPPSNANDQVPAELDELVLWATARDPEERPRDARMLLDQVRETESLLHTALPTGSVATQKTMVLPAARQLTAETQVIGGRAPIARETAPISPNAVKLRGKADARRRRGWVAAILVLVLAVAAGGAGWWFGLGPGAHVTIPTSIVNMEPDTARGLLEDLGVEVAAENAEVYSLDVESGLVAGTNPDPGSSIRRGSVVTLEVSKGPRPAEIGEIAGLDLDAATRAIEAAGLELAEDQIDYRFSSKVAENVVMSASVGDIDVSGGTDALSDGDVIYEGQSVALVVSVGDVPDIAGLSVEAATAKLVEAGLKVDPEPQESRSETVDEGLVIGLADHGTLRPNDTVILNVSSGPPLVVVPNVVGDTWAVAKEILTEAGFALDYNAFVDAAPSFFTVSSVDPEPGSEQPKGSTLSVRFSG
ncbi:Stk1 family PASTA domain-containing Ser/Thr kinase [Homoserinibacter sp. GY 40078]|uniref:Stk1 family PASTA domain-containing Ser/Thr kinase n=1 Tax=Homoserinibacter sp. GY 40078 TaxID=2603275 RepID=UPI0011CB2AA1|nr:Stk1 family PASTA domain-containing Ser/Thr kinase [Homoserinibacter sp. GY 40078]TXK17698.1 Stk1 family PASTA domain-containing Ser/Thr kinase [Homoserinibacter sp. GY 40078]